jgi:DNA-binding NtrC family response regulator
LILLPEVVADEVSGTAARMLAALSAVQIESRAGFAVCPTDGSDMDTLLSGARAAAGAARPQSPAVKATETATTLQVGDRCIVLADPAMLQLYALIEKLAPSNLPVLIQGETGVGKEFAAWAIHHQSKRQGKPFVSVNCAALPESLVESELFGHERGAFSGAVAAKTGLLETANSGTIFLDEVGELALPIQAKLLRVLETQKLMRVGEVRERTIDVRIVAATNRDLQVEIAAGRFRKDLFFRLGAARLTLPPLRDRRRELPVLVRALLAEACTRLKREPIEVAAEAMIRLSAYSWPGNVRELRNLMEFAAATVDGSVLLPWHVEEQITSAGPPGSSAAEPVVVTQFRPIEEELRELEKQRMAAALSAAKGVHVRAAELISMPIRTFSSKLKQYELSTRKEGSSG